MSTDTLEALARQMAQPLTFQDYLIGFIDLSHIDSHLYLLAMEILGDTQAGAAWFADKRPEFEGVSAWAVLARGEREKIIEALETKRT